MNLGQAVAVCLYELARDSKISAAEPKQDRATAGEVDRLDALLLEALHESGYLKPDVTPFTKEKMRRIVRRMDLSAGHVRTAMGMLRQILWKMKSSGTELP